MATHIPAEVRQEQTQWTIILRAKGDSEEARIALGELVRIYQRTVRCLVVRLRPPERLDVDDIVQDYFQSIITRSGLKNVNPELGSFKCWLKASVRNHTLNRIQAQKAQKTGNLVTDPGEVLADFEGEEHEPYFKWDTQPDERYDAHALNLLLRAEALDVCDETIRRMKLKRLKPEQFAILCKLLPCRATEPAPLAELTRELNLSEPVLRDKIKVLRKEFRDTMCEVIADGLQLQPGEDPLLHYSVRRELKELCEALSYTSRPCSLLGAREKAVKRDAAHPKRGASRGAQSASSHWHRQSTDAPSHRSAHAP